MVYRIAHQFDIASSEKLKRDLERIKILEDKIEEAWKFVDDLYHGHE